MELFIWKPDNFSFIFRWQTLSQPKLSSLFTALKSITHPSFYRFSFILYGIIRALFIGVLQTSSDYLLKPFLAVIFNGILQPLFTLIQNVFQSTCDMSEPLTKMTGNMLRPFTELVQAFRIVEVKNLTKLQHAIQPSSYSTFQGQAIN